MHEGPRVVFAGGGSGGHLYPALALGDALARLRPDVRAVYVGSQNGLEARVLPERGLEHVLLPVQGFHRGALASNARFLPALVVSLDQMADVLQRLRPELVVLTGGYASGPAGLMAVLRGIPVVIQEQNAVPGITTRLLAPWARQVHVAFPEAVGRLPRGSRASASVSGNPIRVPVQVDEGAVMSSLGLDPALRVVIVVGGSQGSAALNAMVTEAVRGVVEGSIESPSGWQVLWATGPKHLQAVSEGFADLGGLPAWVQAVGYIDDMPAALSVASLAVSRSGAMATSEFLAWGLPAVLVPLPTAAAGHQAHNATALADAGAAIHLPQRGLEAGALWREVAGLMDDAERLAAMSAAATERSRPDAAERIARDLAALLPAAHLPSLPSRGGAG